MFILGTGYVLKHVFGHGCVVYLLVTGNGSCHTQPTSPAATAVSHGRLAPRTSSRPDECHFHGTARSWFLPPACCRGGKPHLVLPFSLVLFCALPFLPSFCPYGTTTASHSFASVRGLYVAPLRRTNRKKYGLGHFAVK